MNVAVVYVWPQVDYRKYHPLAQRFTATWRQFPGRNLHVIANGNKPTNGELQLFAGIPYELHLHNNFGWDIGAFQLAAETIACDLLVCLGACVHFHHPGWLERMVDAYVAHGVGLYGCWAYLSPNWHVRTTAFWCPRELIQSYPYQIGSARTSRYMFEHGSESFTRHVLKSGFPAIMVTQKGCFPFEQWHDHAPGVEDSLCLDQHTHR